MEVSMKRDMDLVREILLHVSESNESVDASVFIDNHNDLDKIIYTIDIMKEAGFIKASIQKAFPNNYISASIKSITWSGHDLLDSIRSEKVWKEVKKVVSKVAISTSVGVVKTLAENISKEMMLND